MNNVSICAGFLLPHPPVIVPEVGMDREKEAKVTIDSMNEVAGELERLQPDTVVIISPHAPMFRDFVFIYDNPILEGSFQQFGSDLTLSFEQDSELRIEIEQNMKLKGIVGGGLDAETMKLNGIQNSLDHGCMVPLYYISKKYRTFKLVSMSCSAFDLQTLYKIGQAIKQSAEKIGRRVVVIASGDMSHKVNSESPYGAVPEGEEFDELVVKLFNEGDVRQLLSIDMMLRSSAAECGYNSIVILCGTFDGQKPDIKVLSYEAPFGIGYCVASFYPTDVSTENPLTSSKEKDESLHVKIARTTLENFVRNHKKSGLSNFLSLDKGNEIFSKTAGVFVSLKKFGELRGCIGTTEPTTLSIAEEIIQNAISAGTRDPRFNPVEADELEYLTYSVDVLGEAEPATKEELNEKKYGVIVEKGYHRGLLLPDLEGVDSVEHQLEIACNKASIDPKEDYDIYKFTVTRYK
jgi:AmmeMemoRadiSam system protein A